MKKLTSLLMLVTLLCWLSPLHAGQGDALVPVLSLLLKSDSSGDQIILVDDPTSEMLAMGVLDGNYVTFFGERDSDGWASKLTKQIIVDSDDGYTLVLLYDDQGRIVEADGGSVVFVFTYLSETRVKIAATYEDGSVQVEEADYAVMAQSTVLKMQSALSTQSGCGGLLAHYGTTFDGYIHTLCDDDRESASVYYEYKVSNSRAMGNIQGVLNEYSNPERFSKDGHVNKYRFPIVVSSDIPDDYSEFKCSCDRMVESVDAVVEGLKSLTGLSGMLDSLAKEPLEKIIVNAIKDEIKGKTESYLRGEGSLAALISKGLFCSESAHGSLLQSKETIAVNIIKTEARWHHGLKNSIVEKLVTWRPYAKDAGPLAPSMFLHPLKNAKAVITGKPGQQSSGSAPFDIEYYAKDSYPLNEDCPTDQVCANYKFTLKSEAGGVVQEWDNLPAVATLNDAGTYTLELVLLGVTGQTSARKNITVRGCGDGIVDSDLGEDCDDGNNVDGDWCPDNCVVSLNSLDSDCKLTIETHVVPECVVTPVKFTVECFPSGIIYEQLGDGYNNSLDKNCEICTGWNELNANQYIVLASESQECYNSNAPECGVCGTGTNGPDPVWYTSDMHTIYDFKIF